MKIVGLTGGIGSGKTTACKVFERLEIPVYYSDFEAKKLMNSNTEIIEQLVQRFGKKAYINYSLNRKYIAEQIFNNKSNLNFVNSIVHPIVRKHFSEWTKKQKASYVINENAILFESGFYKDTDLIITVTASEEARIERVMKRDNTTADVVKSRIKNQISEGEKIKQSDFIIYNENNDLILPQILKVHNQITNISQ